MVPPQITWPAQPMVLPRVGPVHVPVADDREQPAAFEPRRNRDPDGGTGTQPTARMMVHPPQHLGAAGRTRALRRCATSRRRDTAVNRLRLAGPGPTHIASLVGGRYALLECYTGNYQRMTFCSCASLSTAISVR